MWTWFVAGSSRLCNASAEHEKFERMPGFLWSRFNHVVKHKDFNVKTLIRERSFWNSNLISSALTDYSPTARTVMVRCSSRPKVSQCCESSSFDRSRRPTRIVLYMSMLSLSASTMPVYLHMRSIPSLYRMSGAGLLRNI